MRSFTWNSDEQRHVWTGFVDTFQIMVVGLRVELGREHPNVDKLDELCGALEHDLKALRSSYHQQFAARPHHGKVTK